MNRLQINQNTSLFPVLDLLDFCKGLAIIWIVLIHWRPEWFGWQGVHVFIVLSGFGLSYSCLKKKSSIKWSQWYFKRFRKTLPAYWMVCLWGYLLLVCIYILEHHHLLNAFLLPLDVLLKNVLLLDLTLLNPTVKIEPNGSLWFIPFIISFYLAFPLLLRLITKYVNTRNVLFAFLAAIIFEFIYRGIALYWLDGRPIGYFHYFDSFPIIGMPLDRIPDSIRFQNEYAFNFFPSRLGEFAIGMVGAVILLKGSSLFHKVLLNYWVACFGFFIWLFGNYLIYQGFWGWVTADFVIAVGIIMWFINIAYFLQKYLPLVFSKISLLGVWSYYIFLTHYLLVFVIGKIDNYLITIVADSWIGVKFLRISLFATIILGTWIASIMLEKFDKSRFLNQMIQKYFHSFL
jgi:peptidoglycan/LPS O-acetylase OafA/YrhL